MNITNRLTNLNFSNPDDLQLLTTSFEYAVTRIFQKYCSFLGIKNKQQFQAYNDFSIEKLIIYPFFIATSNGHSKSLFNLFGDFRAHRIGPISIPILALLSTNTNRQNFDHYSFDRYRLNLNANMFDSNNVLNWDLILQKLRNKTITVNGINVLFGDLMIDKDDTNPNQLYKGIDRGIEVLTFQSGGRFFCFNERDLLKKSHRYEAYTSKKEKQGLIDYDKIVTKTDKSPYFSAV